MDQISIKFQVNDWFLEVKGDWPKWDKPEEYHDLIKCLES